MSAGALSASSLPAHAAVVTTRLAQGYCRVAWTALQQWSHWLAPLRLVGAKMPRVCHRGTLGAEPCCLKQRVPLGQLSRAVTRATVDDRGKTALVACSLAAGLRISPCLAAAGFQEMSPALALDVASKGDALTGIKRAEGATFAITGVTESPLESSRSPA